jgi:Fic family protein
MPPPNLSEILAEARGKGDARLIDLLTSGYVKAEHKYIAWEKLRYMNPPEGMSHEEWWLVTRMWRDSIQRATPLKDKDGAPFTYALPDEVLQAIDDINTNASGQISISEQVTNAGTRDRYLVNSLIEEAITSSQLEGASTEHRVAKEMLRSGRSPRDRSERMILNNFTAMREIGGYRDQELSLDLIREIHRIVTDGTLENPEASGRFQLPGDERVAVYDSYNRLLHTPPPADEIESRMQELCDFANGKTGDTYLPAVLRAITVHFIFGYIHPFEDGNGRTARTLFYWSMLNQGFWLTEFLTVSKILKNAPSKYGASFLLTEQDNNDLTYFHLYQLGVIQRAIRELRKYLADKMNEVRQLQKSLMSMNGRFNHRQIALIDNAVKNPSQHYTVVSHSRSHGSSPETARKDLVGLEEAGILTRSKAGRANAWIPAKDIVENLGT